MLSLLNNSFNSRPRLGIPLLGQGKLAFDQQGQDDSDPLAEHADQPIPSGAFRASLVNVGGGQMRHGLLGLLVVVALPADGNHPEGRQRDGQPHATGAIGLGDSRLLPLPARRFELLEIVAGSLMFGENPAEMRQWLASMS